MNIDEKRKHIHDLCWSYAICEKCPLGCIAEKNDRLCENQPDNRINQYYEYILTRKD